MSIFERIKNFFNNLTRRKIEERTGPFAPKYPEKEADFSDFREGLKVVPVIDGDVSFGPIPNAEEIVKKNFFQNELGWTYEEKPSTNGTFNGHSFVALKKKNVSEREDGLTVCVEDGEVKKYTVIKNREDESQFDYTEEGDEHRFHFGSNGSNYTKNCSYMTSVGEYSIHEFAEWDGGWFRVDTKHAEVPLEPEVEYGTLTGVKSFRELENDYPDPMTIDISVVKEPHGGVKKIHLAYPSREAYLRGEKPFLIKMEGIDGRWEEAGVFRLRGDEYVDNSTIRRENGEYKFDTVSFEQIMEIAGKMPTKISGRVQAVIEEGGFEIPSGVDKIFSEVFAAREERVREKDWDSKPEEDKEPETKKGPELEVGPELKIVQEPEKGKELEEEQEPELDDDGLGLDDDDGLEL